jgi:ABC-type maltose transport system permease subunit
MSFTFDPDHIEDVTPSDTDNITTSVCLMVTTEGDVAVETASGTTGTLPGCLPGVQYYIRARKVLATGTTATGIKSIY